MSLKAAIEKSKPNRMKCSVAIFRAKLTPAQQSELDESCRTSVDELSHAVLSRAIALEWDDRTLTPNILQRHRARECTCEPR